MAQITVVLKTQKQEIRKYINCQSYTVFIEKIENIFNIKRQNLKWSPRIKSARDFDRFLKNDRILQLKMKQNSSVQHYMPKIPLGSNYICLPLFLFASINKISQIRIKQNHSLTNDLIKAISVFSQTQIEEQSLQWIGSFITACFRQADFFNTVEDIQDYTKMLDIPTFDFDYFFQRLFETLNREQKKSNIINELFGFQVSVVRRNKRIVRNQGNEKIKQIPLKPNQFQKCFQKRYFFECDLSKPSEEEHEQYSLIDGIKQRFKERKSFSRFGLYDVCFQQETIQIQSLPQFAIVHCNRFGYSQPVPWWTPKVLLRQQKNMKKVCHSNELDLSILYSEFLNKKLKQQSQGNQKNKYKLQGVIFHKGKYYRGIKQQKTQTREQILYKIQQNLGDFMACTKQNEQKWLKLYKSKISSESQTFVFKHLTDNQVPIQHAWTPVVLLYKKQNLKDKQINLKVVQNNQKKQLLQSIKHFKQYCNQDKIIAKQLRSKSCGCQQQKKNIHFLQKGQQFQCLKRKTSNH